MTESGSTVPYIMAKPSKKDDEIYTWESQAAQYPVSGPPGISHFVAEVPPDITVECLLYREESGELAGIANYFPVDIPPYEMAGNWALFVRPEWRGQGIGTALMVEGMARWDYREDHITFTEGGAALVNKARRQINATGGYPNFDPTRHHIPREDGAGT